MREDHTTQVIQVSYRPSIASSLHVSNNKNCKTTKTRRPSERARSRIFSLFADSRRGICTFFKMLSIRRLCTTNTMRVPLFPSTKNFKSSFSDIANAIQRQLSGKKGSDRPVHFLEADTHLGVVLRVAGDWRKTFEQTKLSADEPSFTSALCLKPFTLVN